MTYPDIARLVRLGQKAESKAQRRKKVVDGCMTALVTKTLTDLSSGWLFMLAVGVAHDQWWPAVPTIGYWWAVLLVVLTRGLFGSDTGKGTK